MALRNILSLFVFRYSFTVEVDESVEKAEKTVKNVIEKGFELNDSDMQRFSGSVSNGRFHADMITPDVRGVSFAFNGEIRPQGAGTAVTFHMKIKDNPGLKMLMGFFILTTTLTVSNMVSRSSGIHLEQFNGLFVFISFGLSVGYLFNLGVYWGKSRLMERIGREMFQPPKKAHAKKAKPESEGMTEKERFIFTVSSVSLAAITAITMIFFAHPWSIFTGVLAVIIISLFGGALIAMAAGSVSSIISLFSGPGATVLWKAILLGVMRAVAIILLFTGMALFMNGFLAASGFTPWIRPSTEIPVTSMTQAVKDRDGNIYCYLGFSCRIQKYDSTGDFQTGWPVNTGGKRVQFRVNEEGNLELLTTQNSLHIYDRQGRLISDIRLDSEAGRNFEGKCTDTTDAGNTALQSRLGSQPFFLWFLGGPQCFILFAAGMLLNFALYSETVERWRQGGDSQ